MTYAKFRNIPQPWAPTPKELEYYDYCFNVASHGSKTIINACESDNLIHFS